MKLKYSVHIIQTILCQPDSYSGTLQTNEKQKHNMNTSLKPVPTTIYISFQSRCLICILGVVSKNLKKI